MATSKTKSVYVIELNPAVLKDKRFAEANPSYKPGKKCLYVGMTGRDPETGFQQHKNNYKANRYVHDYGKRLVSEFSKDLNPMAYDEALAKERSLAEELRNEGHAVWQGWSLSLRITIPKPLKKSCP